MEPSVRPYASKELGIIPSLPQATIDLNEWQIGKYNRAREACILPPPDSESFDSSLTTAMELISEAKTAIGHLTVQHPAYRDLLIKDTYLQSILADRTGKESEKKWKERMFEFLESLYKIKVSD